MKKNLIIALVAALSIGLVAVSAVFAQGNEPPVQPFDRGQMMRGGTGDLHDYMLDAFAAKLGMTVDEINVRLGAGETMFDIVGADDFYTVMTEVRSEALEAALTKGVITQEQADWMKNRGADRGGNGGQGTGICDGSGQLDGVGGMRGKGNRGGGRWQNTTP